MIDIIDNGNGSFTGRIALFRIDQISYLKVECEVWLIILRVDCVF